MEFLFGKREKISSVFEIRRGVGNKEAKNEISYGDVVSELNNLFTIGLVEISWRGKIKVYKISKEGEKVFENKTFLVKISPKLYRQVFI